VIDREEALRDDIHLESSYDYGEDDEWDDDDVNWNADEEDPSTETPETKDESTAYLNFLNEEVCCEPSICGEEGALTRTHRLRSSAEPLTTLRRMISARILSCSSLLSTRLSLTSSSVPR
jgi:hypothetical protein